MKVLCPVCQSIGSLQIRGQSFRVGHYLKTEGTTVKVLWHFIDKAEDRKRLTEMVKPTVVNGKADKPENSLDSNAEVGKRYSARLIISNSVVKPEVITMIRSTFHNDFFDFIEVYKRYCIYDKKLSPNVTYEYVRILKKFVSGFEKGFSIDSKNTEPIETRIAEFLTIENPNTYRNSLAALKIAFYLLGYSDLLENYKYKAIMPTFNIKTPSLEEVKKFGESIDNPIVKLYYRLGVVSAIRPEHLLRLTKGLIDRQNNMINTFQKTFSQKNFFFSYYTDEIKKDLETFLDTLPTNDTLLFQLGYRGIQKAFVRAAKQSGIIITPKTMRKFSTNWLRRHGMIPEDVDVITSHVPKSIVQRHYLDSSRVKEEYDVATKDLKLL